MEKLIKTLKSLGLTQYEAQAYVALTRLPRATALEVSQHSGVPKAKVYEALSSLAERGFVDMAPGTPRVFIARPPQAVVAALRDAFNRTADQAAELFARINRIEEVDTLPLAWSLPSERAVLSKLGDLIQIPGPLKVMASPDFLELFSGLLSGVQDRLMIITENPWTGLTAASIRAYNPEARMLMGDIGATPHFVLVQEEVGVLFCGRHEQGRIVGVHIELPVFVRFFNLHFNMLWRALGAGG